MAAALVEGSRYKGASLRAAAASSRTILLEPRPDGAAGETGTAILTDISFAKANGGRADYWLCYPIF